MAEQRITSFHGADGCGKSTLAEAYVEQLNHRGHRAIMLGGSSYKQWLTPKIARETLGDGHVIGKDYRTIAERTRLFEEIAVACYGYADHLRDRGHEVVIDSDPVLKRAVWSSLERGPDEHTAYMSDFNGLLDDKLGANTAPEVIYGLNLQGQITEGELHDRITARGGVSEFDPQGEDEIKQLVCAVQSIWSLLKNKDDSMQRFHGSRLVDVENKAQSANQVQQHSSRLACTLLDMQDKSPT